MPSKSVVPPEDTNILEVSAGTVCRVAYSGQYYKARPHTPSDSSLRVLCRWCSTKHMEHLCSRLEVPLGVSDQRHRDTQYLLQKPTSCYLSHTSLHSDLHTLQFIFSKTFTHNPWQTHTILSTAHPPTSAGTESIKKPKQPHKSLLHEDQSPCW